MRAFLTLVTVAMLATTLLGTLVLPLLRIPDEPHHADMVLVAREGDWLASGWPRLGQRGLDPGIGNALSLVLKNGRASDDVVNRSERPNWMILVLELRTTVPTVQRSIRLFSISRRRFSPALTDVVFGIPDFVQELWSFRLASVLAMATLPVLYYLIAHELTPTVWIQLAASVIPLTIPGFTLRDGAMVNNDALLMVWTSVSIWMSIRVVKGDLRIRTAIVAGGAAGLAMLTKGFGMITIPVIAMAYIIQAVQARGVSLQWTAAVAMASITAIVFGGWWWLRNLLTQGQIVTFRQVERSPNFVPDWYSWVKRGLDQLVGSFWGGSFALPAHTYFWLFAILTVGCFTAVSAAVFKSSPRTTMVVSLAFGLILLVAVPIASAHLYLDRGMVKGVQGRYFYSGFAGVAPVALIGASVLGEKVVRWLLPSVAISAIVMNGLALEFMGGQYWRLFGRGLSAQWSGVTQWSALPVWLSDALLVTASGSAVMVLIVSVLLSLRLRNQSCTDRSSFGREQGSGQIY